MDALTGKYLASTDQGEATRLLADLVSRGESVILTVLQGVPEAMKTRTDPPGALNPMDNARKVIESFGPSARDALRSGLGDHSETIRALSANCLGLQAVRSPADVPVLLAVLEKDPAMLVRAAAAAAIVANEGTDTMTYEATLRRLIKWVQAIASGDGWRTMGENAQWAAASFVATLIGFSMTPRWTGDLAFRVASQTI